MFLKTFTETVHHYTGRQDLAARLAGEVQQHYTGPGRKYHNLQHLDHLLAALLPLREQVQNWEVLIFAIAYHDIIYDVQKQDNEECSADVATARLRELGLPDAAVELCGELILATKGHAAENHADINYFTDADLSILGAKSHTYEQYAQQIRQEYAIYPDPVYNPGRRKVLRHFLDMAQIFKTPYFAEKYEQQARLNLQAELEQLTMDNGQ